MKALTVDLENCYGIRKLKTTFDFSKANAVAVYAPNGAMKSSLTQVFEDVAKDRPSKDRIFPARATKRAIKTDAGPDLAKECILVVRSYEETDNTAKASTLLVNQKVRSEFEKLHAEVDKAKNDLVEALKQQAGTKRDVEEELSQVFTGSPAKFFVTLNRIKDEVAQSKAPLKDVPYDLLFDEKVLSFLDTKDFKTAIEAFIKKYNELLAASTYFKKGVFNYYNAAQVAKQLADNGFFDAKHHVVLNAGERKEITTQKELEDLIAKEKEAISNDKDLRKKYAEIEKLIQKNATVREFEDFLLNHEELLTKFANMADFRQEVWIAYLKAHEGTYNELLKRYQAADTKRKELEAQAQKERTQWEEVIEMFNDRFVVPFRLEATNRIDVILGQQDVPTLGFVFTDGEDEAPVDRSSLLTALSTGEKKAFYLLNVLFEIEARKTAKQETLMVVDDIADSFDYKNKYAIIQYLMDTAQSGQFKQILLTHNFDFFRTVESRYIGYANCRMTAKAVDGIALVPAVGIKNIFTKDWKPSFFKDATKKIACISFMRNLVEYTSGEADPDFVRLTSLLHWKAETPTITVAQLDSVYTELFGVKGSSPDAERLIIDLVQEEAEKCLKAPQGINFANKVVLAIATRLTAEKHMVDRISDPAFVGAITANQTAVLLDRYQAQFASELSAIRVLKRVVLMTPENIHLNSFMYEPILDMSDDHLRKLYKDVQALGN